MNLESALKTAVRKIKEKRLDGFEVAGIYESALEIEVKRQMVELCNRSMIAGIAVRVVSGGRMGMASTAEISSDAISKMVDQALTSLESAKPSEKSIVPAPAGKVSRIEGESFGQLAEIPHEAKLKTAMLLESEAMAFDSRIVQVQGARYEERSVEMLIVNSLGIDARAAREIVSCELKTIAEDKGESEAAYDLAWSTRFSDLDPAKIAKSAAAAAVAKLGGVALTTQLADVIFSPKAAALIVSLLAPSFFADNIQRGASRLVGRLNERVYHQSVNLTDDGLMMNGLGSFPFDGEGVPKQRTNLISNGVVAGWLYDAATAKVDSCKSTGNCVRYRVDRPIEIGVGNCAMANGELSTAELFSKVANGIYITDLMGLHTANAVSGDFSLAAQGSLIANGKLSDPLRTFTVAGNIHEIFSKVIGIADDQKFLGRHGAPSFAVSEVSLCG